MFASDVEKRGLRGLRSRIDEIHDHALIFADYSGMRFDDEIAYRRGVPVVTARHSAPVVQTLLHDGPLAVRGHDEAMEVNLESVGDRVVVDPRREPAGANQRFAIEA